MSKQNRLDQNIVMEVKNFKHVLKDPKSGDQFEINIEDISLERGKFVSVLGDSGCGKTTLLTLMGLLRAPDPNPYPEQTDSSFKMCMFGEDGKPNWHDLYKLWQCHEFDELEGLRRKYIGFALQSGELLPSHTVRQNIAIPLALNDIEDDGKITNLLEGFNLTGKENAKISTLSGGEFQRVVLARSIVHSPQLIFIDEPTSALPEGLAVTALEQLVKMQGEADEATRPTVVMITHNVALAYSFSNVIIRMAPRGKSGFVKEIIHNKDPRREFDEEGNLVPPKSHKQVVPPPMPQVTSLDDLPKEREEKEERKDEIQQLREEIRAQNVILSDILKRLPVPEPVSEPEPETDSGESEILNPSDSEENPEDKL